MAKGIAVGFDHFGGPDVFEEREHEITLTSSANVLVRIAYVGVNPVDTMRRSGMMSGGRSLHQFMVLGSEAAGVIEELYAPVEGLAVGDQVIIKPGMGTYATRVAVPDYKVFKMPDDMSFEEGAAFSATALTAYWGIHGGFYDLKESDSIAVIGASGSVGSYLVQLLKRMPNEVLAVASGRNREKVLGWGADVFLDYHNPASIEPYNGTVDFILDASLFNSGEGVAMELASEGATYIGMTTLPDPSIRPDVKRMFLGRHAGMDERVAMKDLLHLYEEDGIDIEIAYTFPLTDEGAAQAHDIIVGSRKAGKILLHNEQFEK